MIDYLEPDDSDTERDEYLKDSETELRIDEDRLEAIEKRNYKEASDYLCIKLRNDLDNSYRELKDKLCCRPHLESIIRVAEIFANHYHALNEVVREMKSDMIVTKFYL